MPGYSTPELAAQHEAAAFYGAPVEYFAQVAADRHGDMAFAVTLGDRPLVPVGLGPHPESVPIEEGLYERMPNGRWESRVFQSGGGTGWNSTADRDDPENLGVVHLGDVAPPGADVAIVRWRGVEHAVPVRNGLIVFTSWDEPDDALGGDEALERESWQLLRRYAGVLEDAPCVAYEYPVGAHPELDELRTRIEATRRSPVLVAVMVNSERRAWAGDYSSQ